MRTVYISFKFLTFIGKCWNDLYDCCLISFGRKKSILRKEQGNKCVCVFGFLFVLFFFLLSPPSLLPWYLERNGLLCTLSQARMVIIQECYKPFLIWLFIDYYVCLWIRRQSWRDPCSAVMDARKGAELCNMKFGISNLILLKLFMVSEGIQIEIYCCFSSVQQFLHCSILSMLNHDLFVCFGRFIQTITLTDIPWEVVPLSFQFMKRVAQNYFQCRL